MVHIVIIGGGIVGATIAYELSKIPNLTITLLEEKTNIEGSTGAALGILVGISSHKKSGRAWELRQKSIERYPSLISELESITQKKIAHNSQGLVHLCFSQESLTKWQALQKIRQSQKWEIDIWDLQQLKKKCPQIQHQNLIGAVYSPSDWQINPTELTQAMLEGAALNGVSLQFGEKIANLPIVNDLDTNFKTCTEISLEDKSIHCDYLVIAAGLGSTALTSHLGKSIKIQPVLGQALQLQLNRNLVTGDFQPVITGEDIHLVPIEGGDYWVGATVEYPDSQDQVQANSQLLEQVLAGAISFCPSLAQATVIKTWSGQRPRPVGVSAPIIERLTGYNNVILATGHYRNGVLLAPATAEKVKKLILENDN